jgi:UDP-N-acetylglucosamine pyrophosphorylase
VSIVERAPGVRLSILIRRGGAPKSAIEVREGMTFLDLSVRQIEHLNEAHKVNVPFILMNSFNTDDETQRIIQKYQNHNINVRSPPIPIAVAAGT